MGKTKTHTHTYKRIYILTYTRAHTHSLIHTYVHTHIHTYDAQEDSSPCVLLLCVCVLHIYMYVYYVQCCVLCVLCNVYLKSVHVYILVEMRNTCQVTNQSSHGELSFHHNPHLRLCWGLGLFTSRVVRSEGSRLKNAALPTYCHCCEFCALKQKPGVLLENTQSHKKNKIPTADRTHHRIRSPSIECSGT